MNGTPSTIPGRCLVLAIALILVGCGGVPTSTSTPTQPAVSVTLNPSSVNVVAGAQTQFSATVQNSTNTAVAWSVDTVPAENSTVAPLPPGFIHGATPGGKSHCDATSMASTAASAKAALRLRRRRLLVFAESDLGEHRVGATAQFTAAVQNRPTRQ